MPKGKGQNPKVVAANEKKAQNQALKDAQKQAQKEAEEQKEWGKGAKDDSKRRLEEEKRVNGTFIDSMQCHLD